MLTKQNFIDVQGQRLKGFDIVTRDGKAVAHGADGHFMIIAAKRYWHDRDLVRKCERLTGLPCEYRFKR